MPRFATSIDRPVNDNYALSKLIHGNLVAFVTDGDFDNILYATIENCLPDGPNNSPQFSVAFIQDDNNGLDDVDAMTQLIQAQDTLAVLSPAYYRAFKPVIEALQNRGHDSLPFKDELVFVRPFGDTEVQSYVSASASAAMDVSLDDSGYGPLPSVDTGNFAQDSPSTETQECDDSECSFPAGKLRLSPPSSSTLCSSPHSATMPPWPLSLSSTENLLVRTKLTADASDGMIFQLLRGHRQATASGRLFERSSTYLTSRLPGYMKVGQTRIQWSNIFTNEKPSSDLNVPLDGGDDLVDFGTTRSAFESQLDESQLDAIELVLHNRVAMIQGPPGTGKTLIGYKLVKLLLSVSTLPHGPIVVMSYKNHILNEFLRGCNQFCSPNQVVRVGGKGVDGIAHIRDVCPRAHLPGMVYKAPEEFKQVNKKFELVPLILEHLPVSELQNLVLLDKRTPYKKKGLASLEYLEEPGELRYRLLDVAKLVPDVYRTNLPLGDVVTDRISFEVAQVVRSIAKSVAQLFGSEQELEFLLQQRKLKLKSETGNYNLYESLREASVWNRKAADEDAENLLLGMEGGARQSELSGASKKDKRTFTFFQSTFPAGGGKKNRRVLTVDLSWICAHQLTDEELQYRLAGCHMKRFMTNNEKAIFIETLVQLHHKLITNSLRQKVEEFSDALSEVQSRQQKDEAQALLHNAKVVGMTTTGAAINQSLLDTLEPAVVIIEEAGEILETQVLACLSSSVQHLILIGDHKQLRPPVDSYELRKKHFFDISMLERLINNGLPHATLKWQGRMLPLFVPLLHSVYDHLETNLKAVEGNTPTNCLAKPMFFWSHVHPETRVGTSYFNAVEANVLVNSVLWCLLQSREHRVHPSKVTIIAMYKAQVEYIRDLLVKFKTHCPAIAESILCYDTDSINEDDSTGLCMDRPLVQVCSVDQYQGDENDYVFVSLVRSNPDNNLGHVRIKNRMCVACSRAKSGLYMFGNVKCLASASHWRKALDYFYEQDSLGESIPLQCPRHIGVPIHVSTPEDFGFDEMYGNTWYPRLCSEPCEQLMSCKNGHYCGKRCHPHFGHEVCKEQVEVVLPQCKHAHTVQCYESNVHDLWNFRCGMNCKRLLDCPGKHHCTRRCCDPCVPVGQCEQCRKIEVDRQRREEDERRRQQEERRKLLQKELEQLRKQEQNSSVVSLHCNAYDPETNHKLDRIKDFLAKYSGTRGDQVEKLELVECWEIVNSKLSKEFIRSQIQDIDKQIAERRKSFRSSSLSASFAYVIPSSCRNPDKFLRQICDHGVGLTNCLFGRGIFFMDRPQFECLLDGSTLYESAHSQQFQPTQMLLICNVALGRCQFLAHDEAVKPGYQSVQWRQMSRNERCSSSDAATVYQVMDPRLMLPVFLVRCRRFDMPRAEVLNEIVAKKAFGLF